MRRLRAGTCNVNLDSKGAHLFHLFAENGGLVFKVAFDPTNPVNDAEHA